MSTISIGCDPHLIGSVIKRIVHDVIELDLADLTFEKHQIAVLIGQPSAGGFHDLVGLGITRTT